jgi:predicted dehydrogenase
MEGDMATMKNRRLKVGVVGASIAHSVDGRENFAVRAHLPALKSLPDLYEIAAVCTTRMESANETAKLFDVPRAFDRTERMLREMPELDAICVSVRASSHFEVAMPALEAGKHVYCEHPGSISTQQARAMWDMASGKNLRTMTGHQDHFEPAVSHMARLVAEGFVGQPLTFSMAQFTANHISPRPYHHRRLFDAAAGGRPGYRSGHSLERIMAVLGESITSVSADFAIQTPEHLILDRPGETVHSTQVDNMIYQLRTESGAMGALQISNTAWFGSGDRFEVYGTDGMLFLVLSSLVPALAGKGEQVGSEFNPHSEFRLYGSRADLQRIIQEKLTPESVEGRFTEIEVPRLPESSAKGRSAHGVARAWVEFAAAISEGQDRSPTLYDTYKIHRIWDAAEESTKSRRWVDVDQ